MCMKTPAADPSECDCFDCVEARRRAPAPTAAGVAPKDSQEAVVLESWRDAFQEAYREVQKDIFKAKIKAGMSKTMEKTAGLVMEAMVAEIGETVRRARFQKGLNAKLKKLIESAGED